MMKNDSINWPVMLVFTRFTLALLLQFAIAAVLWFSNIPAPLETAGHYFTVYGTIIDLTCLLLVIALLKREGISLRALVSPGPSAAIKTVVIGMGYLAIFLPVSVAGMSLSGYLFLGDPVPQQTMGGIPGWGILYSATIWPILWAIAEQVTYQGYALPRIEKATGRKWIAVAIVGFGWSLQHVALPFHPDLGYLCVRVFSFLPVAILMTTLYFRIRKLAPFIFAHWAMDFTAVVTTVVLPKFQ